MAQPDLITSARAAQNAKLAAISSGQYLSSLVTAASDSIRIYCARDFAQQSYADYYTIGVQQKQQPLLIRQYPVIEVTRVALVNQAMLVQNSNTSVYQRATVETTAAGIVLKTMASAVPASTTLAYASYPTLNAMAAAITTLGGGWNATVWTGSNGSYGLWPSADLKPLQGAASAFQGGAYLEIYEDVNTGGFGTLNGNDDWDGLCGSSGPAWRLDPETGEFYFRSMRGSLALRIDYIAGFLAVPQPVQEACVQLTQWLYQSSQALMTARSVKLGNTSVEFAIGGGWPASVKMLLAPYKDRSRDIYR